MVAHVCNPRTCLLKAKGSKFQCHPHLKSKFETRLGYKRLSQNNSQLYGVQGERSQGSRRAGMELPKGLVMGLGAVREEHSN